MRGRQEALASEEINDDIDREIGREERGDLCVSWATCSPRTENRTLQNLSWFSSMFLADPLFLGFQLQLLAEI